MSDNVYAINSPDELYHYGVVGMKWGVRRYQNKDGSLTAAGKKRLSKDLKKEYKRGFQSNNPLKVSDAYKHKLRSEIDKVITDDDKTRISAAKTLWLAKEKEAEPARKEFHALAEKHARKAYETELRDAPDGYATERDKQKLLEYLVVEYGNDMAFRARPDLYKAATTPDEYYDAYREECRKVTDKLLGKYGDTKLHNSKYSTITIRDTVGNMVSSMTREKNDD